MKIKDIRVDSGISIKELEEIISLTVSALVDSNENQRTRAIRKLVELFDKNYDALLRSGFQGDGLLMLSCLDGNHKKEIYYVTEVPLNGLGNPVQAKPFLVSERGIIYFPYKRRCGFEELR